MKIKSIQWKNVASYGNRIQTLEFPEEPGLIQVIGENGVGKSTISDVITFGLYGNIEGKKLKDIPNRTNQSAWMQVIFEEDGKTYSVNRGLAPSIFELSINGIPYDRAGKTKVQDFLNTDVLKIPYYVFNNTISLSINDFKSFLKMNTENKKKIIDKIFGFYILNDMRELLKAENRNIKSTIDKLSGEISATGKSISTSQGELEALQKKILENAGDEINITKVELANYKELLVLHIEKLKSFKVQENTAQSNVTKAYEIYSNTSTKLNDIDSKKKLYNNKQCPTCTSALNSEYHQHILDDLNKEQELFSGEIEALKNNYTAAQKIQRELAETKNELFSKGGKIETGIRNLADKLKNLETGKNDEQVGSIRKILNKGSEELIEFNKEKIVFEERQLWIKTLDEILSERGVKQLAIKSILPSLNSEILNTLQLLHLPYKVVFNEDFNAQIFHIGEEISHQTLSTGEMKKVDFAVLIAIIKLMKIRFSSVNLLFLDEIFSSVDPHGVHSILTTLRKLCDDLKMNIFVINHAPMPTEMFDYKIDITKKNNFSDISFEKLL